MQNLPVRRGLLLAPFLFTVSAMAQAALPDDSAVMAARDFAAQTQHEHTTSKTGKLYVDRRAYGEVVSKTVDQSLAFQGCEATFSSSVQFGQRTADHKESGYRQIHRALFQLKEVNVVALRRGTLYLYFQLPSTASDFNATEESDAGFADFHETSHQNQPGASVVLLNPPGLPGPATMEALQASWIVLAYACGAPHVEAQTF